MKITTYFLAIMVMVFALSCGKTSSTESEEEHEHAEGMDHNDAENHDMTEMDDHDMEQMDHSEMMTWMPGKESMNMLENATDNIVLATSGEQDILLFEPAGSTASCMFKNMHGNVGVTATLKFNSREASVKLVHHSSDNNNYEFVWLDGKMMKLGRVENGQEKILDSKEVEVPSDWFKLTVSAAGEHYKGFINDKMITHGHAEEMKPGLLGIIASGSGTVSLSSLEATPLEAEH